MIGTTLLHYKIIDKLGEGGMGVVYLAEDTKLDRKVALKLLPHSISSDMEQRARFKREAKVAASLNHKNITTIYAIEETEEQMFIVLEYIDGSELGNRIKSGTILLNEAIKFATQIAEGLESAHSKDIVHRDIKSSNIMITRDGTVKIMDFGLAKIGSVAQSFNSELTAGTLSYMSPEQARGEDVDIRTDIWSYGVVLYEMLTGLQPFNGSYEQAIVYSIMCEDPIPVKELSKNSFPVLEEIITKCLQKEPRQRYQNFTELLNFLKEFKPIVVQQTASVPDEITLSTFPAKEKRLVIAGLVRLMLLGIIGLSFTPANKLLGKLIGTENTFTQQHLSILPIRNYGDNSIGKAFSDGLLETMTSKVTQLEQINSSLWVVPASEILTNNIKSAGKAKEMFGVNLAVTGGLQSFNDIFRLTLNLIDTKNMRQLNSSVIDVKKSDLAQLQNLSIIKLIEMLDLELNPKTHEIISEGNTQIPEAYQYYLQGRGYLQRFESMDNINAAIRMFDMAISKDSLYTIAYAGLAESYWQKYESTRDARWREAAILSSKKSINLDSNLATVNITAGLIFAGIGNNDRALHYFNRALDLDPMNASVYRGLAHCYVALNQTDKAERTYLKAIELKPDYWAGYNVLGSFYYKYGRYEEAIKQFKKVTELTPDNSRGYNNLGGIYYFIEDWDDASAMFEKSLSIEKSYSVASNLGTLNYIQGKYNKAAKMYEMALELNDKDYIVWGNLASALYWIPGKREKAIDLYRKAIQLIREEEKVNPYNAELISNLAAYYSMTGESSKAFSLVKKSIELAPNDVQIIFRAGTTYEQLGNRRKALYYLESAIKNGYSKTELQRQPDLRNLITDEQFKNILSKY